MIISLKRILKTAKHKNRHRLNKISWLKLEELLIIIIIFLIILDGHDFYTRWIRINGICIAIDVMDV